MTKRKRPRKHVRPSLWVAEDGTRVRVVTYMGASDAERVAELAGREGVSVAEWVRVACRRRLRRKGRAG